MACGAYRARIRRSCVRIEVRLFDLGRSRIPMKAKWPSRVARVAVICAALGLLVTWRPFVGSAGAVSEPEKVPAVELAHGTIGVDQWQAFAMAPENAQERKEGNLCLSIFFLEVWPQQERAEGNEQAQCGELGTNEVMFESYTVHRRGRKPHSAVAFLLDGSASRMVLKLRGHAARTVQLRHVSPQPATAGRRMAYFARGYAQPFCLQHLVAYSATGQPVAHLGGARCL